MANLDSSLLRAPSQLILECAKMTVKTNHYSYICKCDSKFIFQLSQWACLTNQ